MEVHVKFYGKISFLTNWEDVTLEKDSKVEDLIAYLNDKFYSLKDEDYLIMVNDKFAKHDHKLNDQDEVSLLSVVDGG